MANWYVSSTGWTAVTAWAASTAYTVGALRRQLATPAVGSERVFRCTTAGTSGAAEPTWVLTKGATTTSGTAVFTEVTGQEAYQASGAWGAPHARLSNAFASTWMAAGDTAYVAHDHAETQAAAVNIGSPGTSANPCFVYCVSTAGSVPPASADLRTTATVTTTGANGIALNGGTCYLYGLTLSSGSGANSVSMSIGGGSGASHWNLTACKLRAPATTGSTSAIVSGVTASSARMRIVLVNTTVEFGASGSGYALRNVAFEWRNTASAVAGAVVPSTLFTNNTPQAFTALLEGVDLSALGSGATIFAAISAAGRVVLKDCRLGASVVVNTTAADVGGVETVVLRSDSAGTNYRDEKYAFAGTQVPETTIIRTGGASNGATAVSVNLTSTTGSKWILPFEALPFVAWNASTGAATATVEGVWNSTTLPTNAEVWFDLEYLGSASSPLGSFSSGTKADNLAAGTSLTASTSAWDSLVTARANSTAYALGAVRKVASNADRIFFCTTAGTSAASEPAGYASAVDGGSVTDGSAVFRAGVRFKQSIAFTAAQAGAVYAYPKLAKASTTVYLDPLLTIA